MHQLPSPLRLETERLVLVMPAPSDARAMLAYFERNRAHLAPWEPPRRPDFYSVAWWEARLAESRKEYAEDRAVRLALFLRGTREREVIGTANFTSVVRGAFHACMLGYSLDATHGGRGLMFEGLTVAIRHMFDDLGLHRIMASYMPHNHRSARLLARLGFVIEGLARDYLYIDGAFRDHVLTSLTNPRWRPPA